MVSAEDRRTASSGRGAPEKEGSRSSLAEIAGELARLGRIRAARARLGARRKAFAVFGAGLLVLVAAAIALSGVRMFVGGLSTGLRELIEDDRAWVAELWAGLLLLAGTGVVLLAAWRISERRLLRDHLDGGRRDHLNEHRGMGDKEEA